VVFYNSDLGEIGLPRGRKIFSLYQKSCGERLNRQRIGYRRNIRVEQEFVHVEADTKGFCACEIERVEEWMTREHKQE
jgi:hypothetical protein